MKKTWNEIIVDAIKKVNKPLKRVELYEIVLDMPYTIAYNTFGVYLAYAKRDKVVAYVKIPPDKVGYYCCPEWLDKNGKLKLNHKLNPFWEEDKNEHNQNQPIRIPNT